MSTPIRVRLTRQARGWPEGAELGYATTDLADKHLGQGNYEIVSYMDGSPHETAPATSRANSRKTMPKTDSVEVSEE